MSRLFSAFRNFIFGWEDGLTPENSVEVIEKPVLKAMLMRNAETGELLRPGAKLPTRGSEFAIGLDLYLPSSVTIPSHNKITIPLGIAVAVLSGHYGRLAPKSGVSHKTTTSIEAGVIDSDYRSEIGLIISNYGDAPVTFEAGKAIAQLILERATIADVVEVDSLDETVRGAGGFGSTGAGIGAGSLAASINENKEESKNNNSEIPPCKLVCNSDVCYKCGGKDVLMIAQRIAPGSNEARLVCAECVSFPACTGEVISSSASDK